MTTDINLRMTAALDDPARLYRNAMQAMTYGLTAGSLAQYESTFRLWDTFSQAQGWHQFDMSAPNVIAFLESMDITRRTKQARLSHLRKLAKALYTGQPDNVLLESNKAQLEELSIPKDDDGGQQRDGVALTPEQVWDVLRFWPDDTHMGRRNRALLGVMVYAGLRRSEAVAMRWGHIDFETGLLTLPHRKAHDPNEPDIIPFANWPRVKRLLLDWRRCVPDYDWLFVRVSQKDDIGDDEPISGEAVRLICKQTGDFRPHDLRRTLLTNLALGGTPMPVAQKIAGHANIATTGTYFKLKDAEDLKAQIKLKY